MKYLFLIFYFLSINTLFSQESTKFISINLNFYVSHPWKKVIGTCNSIKIEKSKFILNAGTYIFSTPYNISCPLLNMKTGDTNRDSHMLEVLGYPESKEIIFNVLKVKPVSEKKYSLDSEISIKFTKKNFLINVIEDPQKPGRLFGEFEILLSDFSVERPSLLFIPIEDKVRITFELIL